MASQQSQNEIEFSRVFSAEFPYVWASLRRLGVHDSDAEDVACEVFMRIHQKWETFDSTRPVRPWLFGFAYRAAADFLKLQRHRVEIVGAVQESVSDGVPTEQALLQAEEARLVSEALNMIPMERRAVLIAYEIDGSDMAQVSQSLEIPLHTAYSRLRVARKEFEAAVRRIRLRRGEA